MSAFAREFGVCNGKGKCALEPYYLSLLNSLVYVGFAVGEDSRSFGSCITVFFVSCFWVGEFFRVAWLHLNRRASDTLPCAMPELILGCE